MPRNQSSTRLQSPFGTLLVSRGRRQAIAIALFLVLSVGQGCFTYHATAIPDIQPEEEVRVTLEDRSFRRVAPGADQSAPPRLEGRFGGATADSLTLQVWIGEAYAGTPFYSSYQNLMLPLDQVIQIENRQLDKGRTALVTAGVLVTIGVLIESVGLTDVFGSGGGDGPPDPPEPQGITFSWSWLR